MEENDLNQKIKKIVGIQVGKHACNQILDTVYKHKKILILKKT